MNDSLPSWVKERFFAAVTQGSRHFPLPLRQEIPLSTVMHTQELPTAEQVLGCKACPLAAGKGHVFAEKLWQPSDVFVLCDEPASFNTQDPSAAHALFSESKSSTFVIHNLLQKLKLKKPPFRSFALKCMPTQHASYAVRKVCAENNLLAELVAAKPKTVLIFGVQAQLSFLYALRAGLARQLVIPPEVFHADSSEMFLGDLQVKLLEDEFISVEFLWGSAKVLAFPSSSELTARPEWRSGVWQALGFLLAD